MKLYKSATEKTEKDLKKRISLNIPKKNQLKEHKKKANSKKYSIISQNLSPDNNNNINVNNNNNNNKQSTQSCEMKFSSKQFQYESFQRMKEKEKKNLGEESS